MSVSSKLNEDFSNVHYKTGSHQICPKCVGNDFSITKDDSLGLCFSASCRFRITDKNTSNNNDKEMKINDRMFRVFKEKFKEKGNANKYCTDERKIEPIVLEKALIGEVCELPKDLKEEVETLHASTLKSIEQIIRSKQAGEEYKDDETFKGLTIRKNQLQKFLDFFKNLHLYQGWLVTAFTDENQNILSFNLRKPYSKDRRSFKPFLRKGVFGLNSVGEFLDNDKGKNNKLLLTEGEFNSLQFLSCLAREGIEIKTAPIISFGSATAPDMATVQALNSTVYLCRDNDAAGESCVLKFAEKMNFYSFTTPTKDLDELLKPSNTKNIGSKVVKELISSAEFIEMDFEATIEKVNKTRDGNNNKAHRKSQITTDFVISDLKEKGKLFKSQGRYFYLRNKDRLIYPILPKDEQLSKLLITFYKVNPSKSIYGYIISELTNEAMSLGKEAKISFFTHYNKADNSLFVYNFQDVVYQIKANGTVNKIKNGDKDILFLQSKNAKPFKISLETKLEYSPLDSLLFNEVFNKGNFKVSENGLTHRENAILLMYYFYAFLFISKYPTKPIACLIGEKGSGKTTICKLIGSLIYGESFKVSAMPSKEGDFDALITNGSFQVLDNVDSTPDWLMDKLAVIGTGGDIIKRKLYSDNTTCGYSLDCMLFITARTPRFTRDDIAERIIPFYFDRLKDKGFLPENTITDKLLEKRDAILSEIIELHIPFILKAIEEFKGTEFKTTFRMADFAEFSTLLSKKLGIQEEHDHIFKCLEKSQKEFALRDSPLYELLDAYITMKASATQNHTTVEIFHLLQSHPNYNGNKMPYKSASQFTSHFTLNMEALRDYFNIEVFKERSNRKKYCITKIENNNLQEGH